MKRHAKGHVLALSLACMAAVGALIAAGAQWRLGQQRAVKHRWAIQAAEVLAQSALVRAEADLRAGRALPKTPIELHPGVATVERLDANRVQGCGQVKRQRVCLTAHWMNQRLVTADAAQSHTVPSTPRPGTSASDN